MSLDKVKLIDEIRKKLARGEPVDAEAKKLQNLYLREGMENNDRATKEPAKT